MNPLGKVVCLCKSTAARVPASRSVHSGYGLFGIKLGRHVCVCVCCRQELTGVLRRALSQQAPVREALYDGILQVL